MTLGRWRVNLGLRVIRMQCLEGEKKEYGNASYVQIYGVAAKTDSISVTDFLWPSLQSSTRIGPGRSSERQ